MTDYQIIDPPFTKEVYLLSEIEAKQYFEWYMTNHTQRCEYVLNKSACINASHRELEYTPDKLIPIWKWFLDVAEIESCNGNNISLSKTTWSIIRDIGMYVGETFVRNYSSLSWSYHTKPKKDFFVNAPGITGFLDKRYDPPFPLFFEPTHMVSVQAAHIVRETQHEKDLLNLYMKWVQWI